ncbi:MAG TPA: hypothetical protein VHB20_16915 [Verrucomicrobiae bacterium]|jgi:hypothetical protein|nr:hypothetical protein [Verrucomicrobiae bacterium]
MKIVFRPASLRRRAFTLAEVLIVSGLAVLVGAAMILCNMFGASMAIRQQIWMDATGDSARTVGTIMNDIRSAQIVVVGNYVNNTFVPVPSNTNQWGDACRAYFSNQTNTPPWVDYYYSNTNLYRTNYNGPGVAGSASKVTANPCTNDARIFTFEDYQGNRLTNTQTIAVVDVYLSYLKFQNPEVLIAPGNIVDLYQIRTKIVPR